MTENYISIGLNDPRAKNISEIIGNKTCNKILNLLAEKELNETQISEELKIPLNSIDYNIKKLVKSGLIETTKHKWSVRGKKMPEYKLADKKIIISPRKISTSILLLPALTIGGLLTLAVKNFTKIKEISADANLMMVAKSAPVQETFEAVRNTNLSNSLAGWEWFLVGIWMGIILFFTLTLIKQKFERR
jgi:DNA-binding transcriptional ArsR family regulator